MLFTEGKNTLLNARSKNEIPPAHFGTQKGF